jgi:uncharacterized protein
MKLHAALAQGRNMFTGYGSGYVAVNGVRHHSSIVVTPYRIVAWDVRVPEALTQDVFTHLTSFEVEILLLGTGEAVHFPHPRSSQPLRDAGIGLEVMDTAAACRTYNILVAEDRRVAAAVLVGTATRPAT